MVSVLSPSVFDDVCGGSDVVDGNTVVGGTVSSTGPVVVV